MLVFISTGFVNCCPCPLLSGQHNFVFQLGTLLASANNATESAIVLFQNKLNKGRRWPTEESSVADPHHINSDSETVPRDAKMRPLFYKPKTMWIHIQLPKTTWIHADPDSASQNDVDPYPASQNYVVLHPASQNGRPASQNDGFSFLKRCESMRIRIPNTGRIPTCQVPGQEATSGAGGSSPRHRYHLFKKNHFNSVT